MRCGDKTASAVQTADGIELSITYAKKKSKGKLGKLPVFRGIAALGASLGSFAKSMGGKKTLKKNLLMLIGYIACVVGLILLETLLEDQIVFSSWLTNNLFVGGMLAAEMIVMLAVLRCIPAFKRLFMYHAAEHKTINCYEEGLPLTVENVRKQSRKHLRCGTNLVANLITAVFLLEIFLPPIKSDILYFAVELAATLLFFGLAYEGMRYAEKHDNRAARAIGFLGGLMQHYLTTVEPTDDMLKCGIAAIKGATEE